jgi:hypothetical protein
MRKWKLLDLMYRGPAAKLANGCCQQTFLKPPKKSNENYQDGHDSE